MNVSFAVTTLANYLAGEFDNQPQAMAEPIWYVHLRLWLRPVPHLWDDSLTLFAEQANIVNLDQPYRPRLWRLRENPDLQVEHYMFKDIRAFQGAGSQPSKLENLTPSQVEFLPGCTLRVKTSQPSLDNYHFEAFPQSEQPCCFKYEGSSYQVSLGFTVNQQELCTYDKGIDINTGKAIWGAILGPYRFRKALPTP
jgi:hypothetical protein